MSQRIRTMAEFDALPAASGSIDTVQIVPNVQWVYTCSDRGCTEFHISEQPGSQRVCPIHQVRLAFVGNVLEVRGMLYARRHPATTA